MFVSILITNNEKRLLTRPELEGTYLKYLLLYHEYVGVRVIFIKLDVKEDVSSRPSEIIAGAIFLKLILQLPPSKKPAEHFEVEAA